MDQHAKMMQQQYEHLTSLRNEENQRLEKDAEEVRAKNEANIKVGFLSLLSIKLYSLWTISVTFFFWGGLFRATVFEYTLV